VVGSRRGQVSPFTRRGRRDVVARMTRISLKFYRGTGGIELLARDLEVTKVPDATLHSARLLEPRR
jgi:hypothetical protein